eukprot:scaffold5738_cov61-Phaeocystis_antarctica.AAC.8
MMTPLCSSSTLARQLVESGAGARWRQHSYRTTRIPAGHRGHKGLRSCLLSPDRLARPGASGGAVQCSLSSGSQDEREGS